jgi:hypothetical protein
MTEDMTARCGVAAGRAQALLRRRSSLGPALAGSDEGSTRGPERSGMRRAATFLRKVGVEITFSQEGRARTRTIRIIAAPDSAGAQPSAPSASSGVEPKTTDSNDLAVGPMRTVGLHADGRQPRAGQTVCDKPLSRNAENAADGANANRPDLSASRKGAAPAWRARL